ncbi:hypothetical protein FACS189437_10960 [Bacteroidia bacterium]|nr:hypothetical protein FACS189437_10960 [Bacteroidia bacterium]
MVKKFIFARTNFFNAMKTIEKKASPKTKTEKVSARDRIQPRRLAGWMKGKIHYDKDADIFNLAPL